MPESASGSHPSEAETELVVPSEPGATEPLLSGLSRPTPAHPAAELENLSTLPPRVPPPPPRRTPWVMVAAFGLTLVGAAALVALAFPELIVGEPKPPLEIVSPGAGEVLSGLVKIRARLANPPSSPVTVRLIEAGAIVAETTVQSAVGREFLWEGLKLELTEGEHTFTLQVGELKRQLRIMIDRTPPLAFWDSPPHGTLRVIDRSLTQLTVRVDGVVLWTELVQPGDAIEPPELGLLPGTHELQLKAMDTAGHGWNLKKTFTVEAADAPPHIIMSWEEGQTLGPGLLPLEVKGADSVELYLDGEPFASGDGWWLSPELKAGPHVLEVRARSTAGQSLEARGFLFQPTGP